MWPTFEQSHPVAFTKSMSSIVITPIQPNKFSYIHLFICAVQQDTQSVSVSAFIQHLC